MSCLFCGIEKEKNEGEEYICSGCTGLLSTFSQEKLIEAYNLAAEKGYPNKAKAIESFMEVVDGSEQKRPERNGTGLPDTGRRTGRPVRYEKRSFR